MSLESNKLLKISVVLSLSFFIVSVSALQIPAVEDNRGNRFNFTAPQDGNGTEIYGTGTGRNARVEESLEIQNNSQFELCPAKKEGIVYSAWLGAEEQFHFSNTPVNNKTSQDCVSWNVNASHIREGKLRFNIWSRNQDSNYAHYHLSESDQYIGIVYENVTVVEKESSEKDFFEKVIGFLSSFL